MKVGGAAICNKMLQCMVDISSHGEGRQNGSTLRVQLHNYLGNTASKPPMLSHTLSTFVEVISNA